MNNLGILSIRQPVLACVMSLLLLIVGGLSLLSLPISEYPNVVPPTVVVTASYPGANAQTVADTVASPIEQEVNGTEGMLYMSSQSTSDGRMVLTVTFGLGTDPDRAQVLVQGAVNGALPRLPEEVRRFGVTTRKLALDRLMIIFVSSPDQSYDQLYVSNYALRQVRDELQRIDGIGDVDMQGARDYAMRVWLDPDRMAALGITAEDVVAAVQSQNTQVAGGLLAEPPVADQAFQPSLTFRGRLDRPEEFESIVVRSTREGRLLRIGDVGRVELGAASYTTNSTLQGQPAVALAITQRPGSNALATAQIIRDTMTRIERNFPPGIKADIVYDPTRFIAQSMEASGPHLHRGDRAGRPGGGALPAELARGRHPADRHSRLDHRHLRDPAGARLHAELAHHVRPDPGHRHRGRRRDRRGGERRAPHGLGALAAGGRAEDDGRGGLRAHRHRAGAGRGLRADGLHQRHLRRLLPAVRGDHLGRHHPVRHRVADALAGPGRAAAEAARPRQAEQAVPADHPVLPRLQLVLRQALLRLRRADAEAGAAAGDPADPLCGPAGRHGAPGAGDADRPDPAAGPRLPHRRLPAAAGLQPQPHGRGDSPCLGRHRAGAGRRNSIAFVGLDGATFTNAPNTRAWSSQASSPSRSGRISASPPTRSSPTFSGAWQARMRRWCWSSRPRRCRASARAAASSS
jgi:hypothetical protein